MSLTRHRPLAHAVVQWARGVCRTASAVSGHCRTSCLCAPRTSSIICLALLTSDEFFAQGISSDFFMNPCAVALVTGAYSTCRLQAFTPSLCRPFLTNRCVPSVRLLSTVNRYLANLVCGASRVRPILTAVRSRRRARRSTVV